MAENEDEKLIDNKEVLGTDTDRLLKAMKEKNAKLEELENIISNLKIENIKLKERIRTEGEVIQKEAERRVLREKSKIMLEFLEIFDNFERAVEHSGGDISNSAGGIILIKNQISQFLLSQGVREIDVIGKTFDPNLCEIGEIVESETEEPNKILKVMRKGYYFDDKILRTSIVSVSIQKKNNNSGGE
jgi:molecular chaperone GrpE